MAKEQSKMGGIRLTKSSFYLAWFIPPGTSFCVLVSRTAGYVTHMSGCVGVALSDGRLYPDRHYICASMFSNPQYSLALLLKIASLRFYREL